MHSCLSVVLVLNLVWHIYGWSSIPLHCLGHLRNHQPSIGHRLLRVESAIGNEQICEQTCSNDRACSMATFNRRYHRCHLFQDYPHSSSYRLYRSNYAFSTFIDCPQMLLLPDLAQTPVINVHCTYDTLPWQRAQTSRSIVLKSYTFIGVSYRPCQELCSAVRYCAGIQYQVRGAHQNRCHLLRSAKPWDLLPSKTWTIYAKRSCRTRINPIDFLSSNDRSRCNFKYFGQGHYKRYQATIRSFFHVSEMQCQYQCSRMINCIGIEFVEKGSQCILLSPNFLRIDGSLDVKRHHYRHHHIYMKIMCHTVTYTRKEMLTTDCHSNHPNQQCGCEKNPCQHGRCMSDRKNFFSCHCDHGYYGDLCDRSIDKHFKCPCVNGGICYDSYSKCFCPNGYRGDFCQIILDSV